MLEIIASGKTLGATVTGLNLAQPLADTDLTAVRHALGAHGVLRFPRQQLTAQQLVDFSARFGKLEINVANSYQEPGLPQIMILSNILDNGKPIGLSDAGQSWHTDMSYSKTIAFANVLYGIKIPHRNGQTLGNTEFCNMHAAYDGLPEDLRKTIEGRRAVFDSEAYFMSRMSRTPKDPITGDYSEDVKKRMTQRSQNVVQHHDMVKVHPRTGRKSIYFSEEAISHIEGMSVEESAAVLEAVRAHVLRPEYVYRHRWAVGDLVMWDNISCLHKAIGDFDLPLHRTMHRTTLASLVPNKAAA